MKLPISEYVKKYSEDEVIRFHMPGHKGRGELGIEKFDITEIPGADSLYEAEGIIEESEKMTSRIFGSKATFFSTEGSSQCIKAMLHLILMEKRDKTGERPYILAARNVHKSFLYGVALLDIDVRWLYSEYTDSLCSCVVTPQQVLYYLENCRRKPMALYLTSPDYLGNMQPLEEISGICHEQGVLLVVDNAHGAYLHFLKEPKHPLDLGADLCCDSAHKTLPVLTGGAYLHIGKNMPQSMMENGKLSLIPYGSTSPSYLTMTSMDICNGILQETYKSSLEKITSDIIYLKESLEHQGWEICESEPLKITIFLGKEKRSGLTGDVLQSILRSNKLQCEYADSEYVVFMIGTNNTLEELNYLKEIMGKIRNSFFTFDKIKKDLEFNNENNLFALYEAKRQVLSIRQAIFSKQEVIDVKKAEGRICGAPIVGCPPAIPIVIAGEQISKNDIEIFRYYNIDKISVIIPDSDL